MQEIESFERGEELGSEPRKLPAETYNTMRLLLDYSDSSCVFVPIRSMQYMAVIDREEIIFVDAIFARRSIEFSWGINLNHKNVVISPTLFHTALLIIIKKL